VNRKRSNRERRRAIPAASRNPAQTRLAFLALGGLAVALTGWWSIAHRHARPATDPQAVRTPWGDVPAGWTASAAYDRGMDLYQGARYDEALRFLHLAAASAQAPWFVHDAYGSTLHQFAMLPWNADHPRVAPRSSFERVRTMQRSLDELERASALATGPDRARTLWTQGRVLNTWGMPWDAARGFRAAAALDAALARDADRYAQSLADPAQGRDLW
jgi:hypothetical protein